MNPYFPNLFQPLKVKNTVFRNRIFAAPTSMKELTDLNHLTRKGIYFFKRKAQGGAASVTLEKAWSIQPDAWTGVIS